ncbi:MAG: type II toxin-antitoxin system PemK/MazF family toxin [Trueperaceae bacterium]|nr:type II toxin-antitoxin system PemK/MazF family toxin [Trueperaceae bacterium]
MARYVPAKGDLVALTVRPAPDRDLEQPALVVSNDLFQQATGLCVVCPIARTERQHPFHVAIPDGHGVEGFILVDQVRAVDARARGVRRLGRAPDAVVDQVLAILDAVLF